MKWWWLVIGVCLVAPACDGGSTGGGGGDADADTDTDTDSDSDADSDTDADTGTGDPQPLECVDPIAIDQAGASEPTGFVECDNGFVHREEVVVCAIEPPESQEACWYNAHGTCQLWSDCPGEHNSCVQDSDGWGCDCTLGCMSDADCDGGKVCACAGVSGADFNRCIPAECAGASDCQAGGLCGLSTMWDDSDAGPSRTACAYTTSECLVDADCESQNCSAWGEPGFTCEDPPD